MDDQKITLGDLWKYLIEHIEKTNPVSWSGAHFDTDGDMILCDDKEATEIVADFLENIGFDSVHTGTWTADDKWYYIDFD